MSNNTLLNMTTAEPVSTDVHSNINDLILKAEMDSKLRQYSMSAYKTPQPITGTAPDIALNPLLAAKKIPSLMKLLKKINLKNPIYHHTNIPKAKDILKSQKIKASNKFPNSTKPNYSEEVDALGTPYKKLVPESFSITRDPKFLARPHSNIGTDVRFIMDRDDLVKKGYKLKPFAEKSFRKTDNKFGESIFFKGKPKSESWLENMKDLWGKNAIKELKKHGLVLKSPSNKMNPRFEFEERILGNLPTRDIKLMDWAKIPIGFGTWKPALGKGLWGARRPEPKLQNLIDTIIDMNQKSTQLPVIMSEQVRSTLKKVQPYLTDMYTKNNPDQVKSLEKLMSSPTYKYNPFKLKNK